MIVKNANLSFARETLRSFVDGVALARAIPPADDQPYAFRVAQSSAFDTAVTSWCILFGSDNADHQPLHWKNMFEANAFRQDLLNALGMTLDEWRAYTP